MTRNARAALIRVRVTSVVLVAAIALLVCVGVTVNLGGQHLDRGDDVLIKVPVVGPDSIHTVHQHLVLARRSGDPVHLMAARASMQRLRHQASRIAADTNELALLNAAILQAGHQFEQAISELESVLIEQPRNQQALLSLASIQRVTGDYQSARRNCSRLVESGADLAGAVCEAELDSLTGDRLAYQRIKGAVFTQLSRRTTDPAIAHWAHLVLAAMANRVSRLDDAQRHYLAALIIEPTVFAVSEYAGWLVKRRRFDAAINLLKRNGASGENAADVLKINLAIALQGKGIHDEALRIANALRKQWKRDSMNRFQHWRERAIAALRLFNDPVAAASFAERNWREQREPRDLRLLVDAAIASNRIDLLRVAIRFIDQTGLVDPALSARISGANV